MRLEDADYLLPLTPNWDSWTSFFNEISHLVTSQEGFVTAQTKVWMQYSYLSAFRDTIAVHYNGEGKMPKGFEKMIIDV